MTVEWWGMVQVIEEGSSTAKVEYGRDLRQDSGPYPKEGKVVPPHPRDHGIGSNGRDPNKT